jgi:dihydroorotase
MKILIQQAQIADPISIYAGKIQDILIENGRISGIGDKIDIQADQVISAPFLHVSGGWLDVFSNFCDPGYEFKETLESGARAAARGGFTDVMVIPNTKPVVDNKSQVEYIRRKSGFLPARIFPIGAVTRNTEGKELAEMYDMRNSGAVAFSDGLLPVQSAGLLLKALQYVKAFDGTIIQIPDDKSIGANGLMNEGIISTQLGLPGKPMMAEELIVARDIKLVRYTDSKLHFTGISSAKSIEYIRRAKASGLGITCSVSPNHLFFTDGEITSYDTNFKVYPPLRTKKEVMALREALLDGTIDCIASHHLPHEFDSKQLEFEYAKFGAIGLETAFSVINTAIPEAKPENWAAWFCNNPRKLFNLAPVLLKKGEEACLTLFDPVTEYVFEERLVGSKSRNSPFLGKKLKGRALGTVIGESVFLNSF